MTYADESAADAQHPGQVALGRVLALSDGVFAIALTLLVLNLGIAAHVSANHVGRALRDQLPNLFAYVLSFVVISLFWLAHQRLYSAVRVVDHGLSVVNLVELGCIALVPFPTEVLGAHASTAATVAFYAGTMVALSLASTAQWVYASRRELLAPGISSSYVTHAIWRGASLAIVFLVSIPIAFVSPTAAKWSWLLLVVSRVLLTRRFGVIHVRTTTDDEGSGRSH